MNSSLLPLEVRQQIDDYGAGVLNFNIGEARDRGDRLYKSLYDNYRALGESLRRESDDGMRETFVQMRLELWRHMKRVLEESRLFARLDANNCKGGRN